MRSLLFDNIYKSLVPKEFGGLKVGVKSQEMLYDSAKFNLLTIFYSHVVGHSALRYRYHF